jgi:molybdopterin/thiamine biosynthesis adenylyltransferase
MDADIRIRTLAGEEGMPPHVAERLARPVRVVVTHTERWASQIAACCLVDLLGRLLPKLVIDVDPAAAAHPLLPPGPVTLAERLEEARHHALIDPAPSAADASAALTIAVGGGSAHADIHIDGSGWVAYLGEAPPIDLPDDDRNPIGPLTAACRGASQVVQRLLGELLPTTTRVPGGFWSAFTMGPWDPQATTGTPLSGTPCVDAVLMGAGSIGGATAYALARVPGLIGRLYVVDPDALEEPNSRKALLARRHDIAGAREKQEVAKAELDHHAHLHVTGHRASLAQFVAARPHNDPLPLVLCAVDSIPARRELADHMPLEAVNSACGDSDISISGHRTDDGPCVYCLYITTVLDGERARSRIIARDLKIPKLTIDELRTYRTPLDRNHLTVIERRRELEPGALDRYVGKTIDELFDAEFLYGEVTLRGEDHARAALQLAFVPALAGILLAGEALKAGAGQALAAYRLGPRSELKTEYTESLLQQPVGMLHSPPRSAPSACLCHSTRRLGLMRTRYGLGQ